ncbi:MAG: thioredoxin domain-containing protein [Gammaproteobacteria bacterium]|nr:thioredoxin domain-containing protein [Gammaproteobacteria bacterium]
METLSQFDFHHRLAETRGEAVVLFSHSGCSSCRSWREALVHYQATHPDTQLFEVDAQADLALTREFEVFHLPAMYFYIKGHYHCRLDNRLRIDAIDEGLELARQLAAEEAP